MANELYKDVGNNSQNFDGQDDVREIVFYPTEKRASRIKNTKVRVTNVISSIGIHFDRENLDGVLDNPLLILDAEPEDTGEGSVLCPNNTLLEKFSVLDDINLGLTTATANIDLVTFNASEQLVSYEIVKHTTKFLKSIVIESNNTELDYYIDYGNGFINTKRELMIPNNTSKEAIYMIQNNTTSTQELKRVTVKYEFW